MCPFIMSALGTALAGGSSAVGAGGIIGAASASGAAAATTLGSTLFAGMSTAALGFGATTTGLSLGPSLYGAKSAADAAEARNKHQRLMHDRTIKASNAALDHQYSMAADRQMQENRSASQQMEARQRAYDDAMGDVAVSAAEAGHTGVNLAAIRNSLEMEMGRGNVSLAQNLKWSERQLQQRQLGYRATASSRQAAAMPQYKAVPSRVMAPLLGTAGVGLDTLGKFGGQDWLSNVSSKYSEKVG